MVCGQLQLQFEIFKDSVAELSVLDILEGPGNLRHQIIHHFSVLMSSGDGLVLFDLLCLQ